MSFPIYTKALWNVITGKDVGWHVTGTATRRSPFNFIVPQLLFFVFLALTSVVAIWRDVTNGELTLATAWNVTNTLILAAFVATAVHEHAPPVVRDPAARGDTGRGIRHRGADHDRRATAPAPPRCRDRRPPAIRRLEPSGRRTRVTPWSSTEEVPDDLGQPHPSLPRPAGRARHRRRLHRRLQPAQLRAESTSASIAAEEFSVGTIYAGTIIEQLVEQGDAVATGQMLFRVRSPLLARDLASEYVTAADLGVAVEPDGTFPVVATVDGTVSEVLAPWATSLRPERCSPPSTARKTLTVEAEFTLTPRDYGRIADGTTVEILLPDDQTIQGKVTDIDVDTLDGQATTSVTIESAALEAQAIEGLYRPGTPVRATLHLRDDGPLAGVTDMLRDFLRKIGL